jgi:hypothetical protein
MLLGRSRREFAHPDGCQAQIREGGDDRNESKRQDIATSFVDSEVAKQERGTDNADESADDKATDPQCTATHSGGSADVESTLSGASDVRSSAAVGCRGTAEIGIRVEPFGGSLSWCNGWECQTQRHQRRRGAGKRYAAVGPAKPKATLNRGRIPKNTTKASSEQYLGWVGESDDVDLARPAVRRFWEGEIQSGATSLTRENDYRGR